MPTLRPFRDYNSHDVVNIFTYSGNVPNAGVPKGTLVKIVGSGVEFHDNPVSDIGAPGAAFGGTVSMRFGVPWKVAPCQTGAAGVQDVALGVTLWDIKEVDENGNKLLYNRLSQEERQCVLSGEAVPVLTRGVIYYSGNLTQGGAGSVGPNVSIYAGANGELSTSSDGVKVGKTLGAVDAYLFQVIKLDCE